MRTRQLYYEDSYAKSFTAFVIECLPANGAYKIVLNQTAFFPEGGGQACDEGFLNGVRVFDVQIEDDEIIHYCESEIKPGTEVRGEIDWDKRFLLMQQHSGEHLVSGIINARYGWNNVGFHMGKDCITIDFSGFIPPEDIPSIEYAANEAVWQNIKTEIICPNDDEISQFNYRSKKEIDGQIRLVKFAGIDLCACCGLHVAQTGEIGLIKLLTSTKFHDGVRIEMMCGKQALEYVNAVCEQNHQNSVLLSAKPLETSEAVRHLLEDRDNTVLSLSKTDARLYELIARRYEGLKDCLVFENGLSSEGVRKIADYLLECAEGRCAVFSGDDKNGYRYAIGIKDGDLREFTKTMNAALQGRGGGKPQFVQGTLSASRSDIEAFFAR